jgi:hypothetical protein
VDRARQLGEGLPRQRAALRVLREYGNFDFRDRFFVL